jgi:hypothetical protein
MRIRVLDLPGKGQLEIGLGVEDRTKPSEIAHDGGKLTHEVHTLS